MKAMHVFTLGAAELQVVAKDKRQATNYLADYIKSEGLNCTPKDWRYQGTSQDAYGDVG